jgi:hypothetical protein
MKARSFEEFFNYVKSEIGLITEKDAKAFYNKAAKVSAVETPVADEPTTNEEEK